MEQRIIINKIYKFLQKQLIEKGGIGSGRNTVPRPRSKLIKKIGG